jgi:DNA-binding NtrC family response regulator
MTVLINGETGTGKEIAAKQVHNLSARRDKPMVAVNCAAIPDTLIESELFGYEKGAFTGATTNRIGLIEAAHGGTLFLDEIGELPLAAQARLLRFIQEGEIRRIGSVATRRVNVRLICATHRDLATLAKDQEFRQDLYYRINVLQLDIPPLRDRGEDIRSMILWFLEGANQRLPGREKMISEHTLTVMTQYGWPGNVRELEHAIERAVIMAEGSNIEPADLGLASALTHEQRAAEPALRPGSRVQALSASTDAEPESELSLEDYFQRFVLEHQGAMNETELAQKLGISRKCLWERRQRLNLPRRKPTRRRSA